MNIIHIINNPVWGGGERYVLDLALAQRRDGHRVTIVSRSSEAVCAPFRANGFEVVEMAHGLMTTLASPFNGGPVRHIASLALRLLKTDGRHYSSDESLVIHTHNFKTAKIAVNVARRVNKSLSHICPGAVDTPRVHTVCTRHLVKPASLSVTNRRLYNSLDAIVFVSQAARDAFLSTNPKVNLQRLHVVHNGVRLLGHPPLPDRSQPADEVGLLFIGRVCPEKGLDVLLTSLSRLNDLPWRLTVCGTGDPRYISSLKAMARRDGIDGKINFIGHRDDIIPIIDSHDIGVLPTVVPEAFGLSLIECMSRAIPVVTTSAGGQREVVDEGVDGLLVPVNDPQALAGALRTLITDTPRRLNMGQEAIKAVVRRFSFNRCYEAMASIYSSILNTYV